MPALVIAKLYDFELALKNHYYMIAHKHLKERVSRVLAQ